MNKLNKELLENLILPFLDNYDLKKVSKKFIKLNYEKYCSFKKPHGIKCFVSEDKKYLINYFNGKLNGPFILTCTLTNNLLERRYYKSGELHDKYITIQYNEFIIEIVRYYECGMLKKTHTYYNGYLNFNAFIQKIVEHYNEHKRLPFYLSRNYNNMYKQYIDAYKFIYKKEHLLNDKIYYNNKMIKPPDNTYWTDDIIII
jgi:hypothetical protein